MDAAGLLSTVVIDPGSGFVKAGLRDGDLPSAVFPSVCGTPRRRHASRFEGDPVFVGDDAIAQRQYLSFSYPVDHGHIDDWLQMEDVWSYIFTTLGVKTEEHPVCISHPPLSSQKHKESFFEAMFEAHDTPEVNISMQAILSLYSTGRTTGLVVEIGEGVTQIVPVFDGFCERSAARRSDMGGQELTMYLQKLLCDNGYALTTRDEYERVRMMKEMYCYVALDPLEEDSRTDLEMTCKLPDETACKDAESLDVVLAAERFYCAEPLFDPTLIHRDNPPLSDLVWQAIQASPLEIRKACLGAVIASGGTTLFPGFGDRLLKEIKSTSPPQARSSVKLFASDDRLFSVWLGGKLFSDPSMRAMQDLAWVTREEWTDGGPSCLHRKSLHP